VAMRDSDSKTRLPSWVKVAIVVVAFAVIAAVVLHLLTGAATARWERYAARLRSGGVPLTFDEIEALRTEIPDERNSALVIERLSDRLDGIRKNRWDTDRVVLVFGRDDPDFFKGIPRYHIEPSREFLEQHRELLDELSVLHDMPTGRFEFPDEPADNVLSMIIPYLSSIRTAAKLEHLDGALKLVEGDLEGAAETVRLQFHIAATLDEHPTVIGRLVQISVEALTAQVMENILRVGELEERTLAELMDIVDTRLAAGTMRWAFLGERAWFVRACNEVASGDLSLAEISGGGGPGGLPYIPELLVRENQMRGVEMLTWLVEAADDPDAMIKATKRMNREASALPVTQVLVKMLLPSLSRAAILNVRLHAQLTCTRAALAAEQFRLIEGRMPVSLNELVPNYLDKVPTDPFEGQPMRFALTDKGIVIYSIGEDLIDDGGFVGRQETRPYYRDNGIRLFKPEHRGLLLTDEPRPDDD